MFYILAMPFVDITIDFGPLKPKLRYGPWEGHFIKARLELIASAVTYACTMLAKSLVKP